MWAPVRCGVCSPTRAAAMLREQQHMVDVEVEQGVLSGEFRSTRPSETARAVVTMCTALPQCFRDTGWASAEHIAAQYVEFALDLVSWVAERPSRRAEDALPRVTADGRCPGGPGRTGYRRNIRVSLTRRPRHPG